MNNHILILGGMGPQASLKLHELLIVGSKQFHDALPESYPSILHASIAVPDFIESEQKYQKALRLLQATCKQLPLKEASAIGIACNTAHLMVPSLSLAQTSFVSMIEAVADTVEAQGIAKIGLLASPHTIRTKLYHKALQQRGIKVLIPSASDIDLLNQLIHQVIDGVDPVSLRPELTQIAKRLIKQGADGILLGCTELPLIGVDMSVAMVDSLKALAGAMLQQHYQESCIL